MRTEFTERLERAADGGMEALIRQAQWCAREAVEEELRMPESPTLRRLRFETAVLLDESPNPDLIVAACAK